MLILPKVEEEMGQLVFAVQNSCFVYAADGVKNVNLSTNEAEFIVKCRADGNPRPDVSWRRTSDELVVSQNSYLVINETDDNHTYICIATNVVKGRKFSATSDEISPSAIRFPDKSETYIYVCLVMLTTCLENLEMSGNLTAVREMSGILLKVREMLGK